MGLWSLTQISPNPTKALGFVQNEAPGAVLNGDYETGQAYSGVAINLLLNLGEHLLVELCLVGCV